MPRTKSILVATFEQKQQLVIAKAGVKLAEHRLKQFDIQQKALDAARSDAQSELAQALQVEAKLTGTPVKVGKVAKSIESVDPNAPKKKGGRPKGSKNKPRDAVTGEPGAPQTEAVAGSVDSNGHEQPEPAESPEKRAVQRMLEEFSVPAPKSSPVIAP